MSQFLELDPTRRDYVVINGKPVASDRVLEVAYYSLMIPKNNWLYGTPDQGSLLYTMRHAKRTGAVEALVASYANDAIQRGLINKGIAKSVTTVNLGSSTTGTSNQVDIEPTTQALSAKLQFTPVR